MKGQITRMHRALAQFILDLHTQQHGYLETYVPYLVNHSAIWYGAVAQIWESLFPWKSLEGEQPYALIPTAEVLITNLVLTKF